MKCEKTNMCTMMQKTIVLPYFFEKHNKKEIKSSSCDKTLEKCEQIYQTYPCFFNFNLDLDNWSRIN